MEVPNVVYTLCPTCDEELIHEVLRGKSSTKQAMILDCDVKCNRCGTIHHTVIRESKLIELPIIVSKLDRSAPHKIQLHADDVIKVGDELIVNGMHVKVTAIDKVTGDSRAGVRVNKCSAKDILTLWSKLYDQIRIKLSINRRVHGRTRSKSIMVPPSHELSIGDILNVDGSDVIINAIKTSTGVLRRGTAVTADIVRVYGREL